MGYVLATGNCIGCGKYFAFNPTSVPSIRHPQPHGPREPFCRDCFERRQAHRQGLGLPREPLADDAYEAAKEEDL